MTGARVSGGERNGGSRGDGRPLTAAWAPASWTTPSLFAGLAVPAFEKLRVRLGLKYLITGDLDGVRIETSGSRTSRSGRALFGPHQDTRFVILALGLDWRL